MNLSEGKKEEKKSLEEKIDKKLRHKTLLIDEMKIFSQEGKKFTKEKSAGDENPIK